VAQPAQRAEWLPAPLAWIALALAFGGLAAHALAGFQGAYLTYGSGVWLSLAGDLAGHGVFYRDLVGDLGYGGTRYFPFFFVTIAGFLKAGFSPAVAGLTAGGLSIVVLAIGAYRIVRAAGIPPLTAAVFAAAAAGPYFALQAAFEVRADVMAAGLNLLGIALVLDAWRSSGLQDNPRILPAALAFLLAFATKVTAFTIPGALVLAALLTGRRRLAARLALALVVGGVVFLGIVQAASGGRAFRVLGAVMFGGANPAGTVLSVVSGGYLSGLFNSHLVIAAMLFAVVTLVAGGMFRRSADPAMPLPLAVPFALWLAATATLGVTLSSPGTVPANQVVEWLAISMVVPALVGAARMNTRRVGAFVAAVMVLWMGAQNAARGRERAPLLTREHRAEERAFVDRVRAFDGPILAESALWPVLAGREVVMPDAFAARIVLREHPEIESRLVAEIEARHYRGIVLEFDPSSREGEAMYGFSHFSPRVIAAVRAHYRLEIPGQSIGFVFVPRTDQSSKSKND